jgi:polyferredoxin
MNYKIQIFIYLLALIFTFNVEAQNNDSTTTIQNEFSEEFSEEFSDEFGDEMNSDEFANIANNEISETNLTEEVSYNRLYWSIAIILYTIIAGIFVKYIATRKFRGLFLVVALVILGFYRGGPCVISSFQNTYLMILGEKINWQASVLFIALIPITYFFGKVFCGWVCYLGAIQEFLFSNKVKIFQTEKAQKIMKITRMFAGLALLIQLTVTDTILWDEIGPFKTAINLYSPNLTGYILLGVVLVSSVFIYRPFCKVICPVGLIHGFVSKIPGASVLGINNSCAGCKTCNTSCKINAITRDEKISKLDNEECIRCGDCMDDCNIKSMSIYTNGNNHKHKIYLKGIKELNIKE